MNDRQKKFCDEYIICGSAAKAARNAGYSKTSARFAAQWLSPGCSHYHPEFREYIDKQLDLIHTQKQADATEVLEYLTSVMRGEHKEETLCLVGEGKQDVVDVQVSAKDRLKAAELIGKRYGLFKENVGVELEPITIVNDLTE